MVTEAWRERQREEDEREEVQLEEASRSQMNQVDESQEWKLRVVAENNNH